MVVLYFFSTNYKPKEQLQAWLLLSTSENHSTSG